MKDKFYLSLDGLHAMTHIMNDEITRDYVKYLTFIRQDPKARRLFNEISSGIDKVMHDMSHHRQIQGIKEDLHKVQVGGELTTLAIIAIVLGGTMLTSSIACCLYYWLKPQPSCKPLSSYPLPSLNKNITAKDVMMTLVPDSWIPGAETLSTNEYMAALNKKLASVSSPLSVLKTDTLSDKIKIGIGRTLASAALIVGSEGAGGDEVVDLVFDAKSAVDILTVMANEIPKLDTDALRLLYDLFGADFKEGPFGVKCHTEAILKQYGKDAPAYKSVCGFFKNLLDKVNDFISNIISTMSPDTAGLTGLLASNVLRNNAFDMAISRLNSYYDRVPQDMKIMIQDPNKLSGYIATKAEKVKPLLLTYGDAFYDSVVNNTRFFAVGISKMFALVYVILYSMKACKV